jgi:hypothetical protein
MRQCHKRQKVRQTGGEGYSPGVRRHFSAEGKIRIVLALPSRLEENVQSRGSPMRL